MTMLGENFLESFVSKIYNNFSYIIFHGPHVFHFKSVNNNNNSKLMTLKILNNIFHLSLSYSSNM